LKDGTDIENRWKDYFYSLYNAQNPVDVSVLTELQPAATDDLPTPDIMPEEVADALDKMKRRKAPGIDNISTEELQAASEVLGISVLHSLFQKIWAKRRFLMTGGEQ